MFTIWMAYFLAAIAASGVFIAAGWRSKRARGLAAAKGWNELPVDHLWGDPDINEDAHGSQADVGAVIRLVLKRLAPAVANQHVQVEVASPFGLLVRMNSAALADLLQELVTAAVHDAPGCRLLITAASDGDRIYIGVTDDMPGGDLAVRQSGVRGLAEQAAAAGGALTINVRPTEGTKMTLLLVAAPENHSVSTETAMPASSV